MMVIGTQIDHKIKYNSEATEPACEIVFIFFWCCFQREFKPSSGFSLQEPECPLHITHLTSDLVSSAPKLKSGGILY
jgi:hypothetical protein